MAKKDIFTSFRKQILANLAILLKNYESAVNEGMQENLELYNSLTDLIEESHEASLLSEFEALSLKGKTIETALDNWFSSQGTSSVGLKWPIFD